MTPGCPISGRDVFKFVQGLCTSDITPLFNGDKTCVANSFLNTKGRIIADCFIYKPQLIGDGRFGDDSLILEMHTNMHKDLMRYIAIYKLRADVSIKKVSNLYSYISTDPISKGSLLNVPVIASSLDPRFDNGAFKHAFSRTLAAG